MLARALALIFKVYEVYEDPEFAYMPGARLVIPDDFRGAVFPTPEHAFIAIAERGSPDTLYTVLPFLGGPVDEQVAEDVSGVRDEASIRGLAAGLRGDVPTSSP